MANPQKENGYTAIANEIMDALSKTRIRGEARQVLDFILRKTYGFNKKQDRISLSQFYLGTGLKKANIVRSLRYLQLLNIVIVIKTDKGNINTYRFNKDFSTWKGLSKVIPIINIDKESLSKVIPTKVDITKVDIYGQPEIQKVVDAYYELSGDSKNKKWCVKNYGRFAKVAKDLLDLTDGNPDKVVDVIKKGGKYYGSKKLSWTLETIFKNWNQIQKQETGRWS